MDASQEIAAMTLWGEARGEPEDGQRAIAHVMVNRRATGRWGQTLLSVCLWPWQFSCWNPSDPNRKRMITLDASDPDLARYAGFLEGAETEPDPTHGALYYKVSRLPWPRDWGQVVQPTLIVGAHSFFILREA
jgi:cell wall hydrolase